MEIKGRSFESQYEKGKIDEVAEREGVALRGQVGYGNLRRKAGSHKKGVKEMAEEVREQEARRLVKSEAPRDLFKKKGV